ncbi:MAG TPA: hypothetical protein VJC15_04425 [Candidatus Paceibacterota bacterium]
MARTIEQIMVSIEGEEHSERVLEAKWPSSQYERDEIERALDHTQSRLFDLHVELAEAEDAAKNIHHQGESS